MLTFKLYAQGLGNTTLHYASQKGYGDVARALIANHCTLLPSHLRTYHARTHARTHARKLNNNFIYFTRAARRTDADPYEQNDDGQTAYELASDDIRSVLRDVMYFCGRYQVARIKPSIYS